MQFNLLIAHLAVTLNILHAFNRIQECDTLARKLGPYFIGSTHHTCNHRLTYRSTSN